MEDLRSRLETKSYEIAYQYFHTRNYKAAITAFTTTLREFPDTPYREDAMYYRAIAAYKLADNSLEQLQEERYREARTALNDFEVAFPTSERLEDLKKMNP